MGRIRNGSAEKPSRHASTFFVSPETDEGANGDKLGNWRITVDAELVDWLSPQFNEMTP
jgi:hypothetical protein